MISFDPLPGRTTPVDSEVAIVVSGGPAPRPVPDVLELSVIEATRILQDLGFVVDVQGNANLPVFETLPAAARLRSSVPGWPSSPQGCEVSGF